MARVSRALFAERTERLRNELLRTIAQEPYAGGIQPLPAEAELARRSGLSRQSVRLVLDRLAGEGVVVRRRHRGVFAGGRARSEYGGGGTHDAHEHDRHGTVRSRPLVRRRQRVTLRLAVFEQGGQTERLRKLIALYRLVEPAVDVQLVELRVAGYGATLAELWRHGMGTDLALLATHHLADMAVAAPAMFADQGIAALSAVPEVVRRPWEVGGALVAAPFIHSPVATAVNLDLLAHAGLPCPAPDWTWDDFRGVAQTVMERLNAAGAANTGGNGGVWGTVVTALLNRWPMHVLQAGGTFVSADGRQPLFETAPFAEALGFGLDLLHKYRVAPLFALDRQEGGSFAGELFARGQVAMLDVSGMALDQLARLPFRWQALPPPRGVRSANLLVVTGIAVGRASPNERACRDFVDYLLSPPVQDFLRLDSYCVPATFAPETPGQPGGFGQGASGAGAGADSGPARAVLAALLPQAHAFTLRESVALRAAAGTLEMALAGALPPHLAIQQMQRAAAAALAKLPAGS
jgi:ABC-type glycerol-3-phosphate transport system substrate-binding protein